MIYCSICGRKMELEDGTFLYKGADERRRYSCRECTKLIKSNDLTERQKIWTYSFIASEQDGEIIEVLKKMTGTVPSSQNVIMKSVPDEGIPSNSIEKMSSGWVSLLRTVAFLFIVIGILASFISGVTLISHDLLGMGLVIIVGGSLLTLITAGAVMVFLDMADDIHAIREMLRVKK